MADITRAELEAMQRDPEQSTIVEAPGYGKACDTCVHYHGVGYCTAFPDGDGIPQEILMGEVLHDEPIDGDDGILYTRSPALDLEDVTE